MKSTLRLKFIMLYIIFGFLSIFTVSLLSNQLLLNKLEQDSSQNMYRIANQTATSYLPSYFSNDLSAWSVHSQLQAMQLYLNASVWFVKTDGTLITSAPLDGIEAPEQILEFDLPRLETISLSPEIIMDTLRKMYHCHGTCHPGFFRAGLSFDPSSDRKPEADMPFSDPAGIHYDGRDLSAVLSLSDWV